MNAITLRNLSDDASRALQARAEQNGTTAEAEAERILQKILVPPEVLSRKGSGSELFEALQQLGRDHGGLDDLDFSRDQMPARAASFK